MSPSALRVAGTLQIPGDKSISHRALVLGALATGTSPVRGLLLSADVRATANCLRALGWSLPDLHHDMQIIGGGLHRRSSASLARLQCDNSGTSARLLTGVAAAQPMFSEFDGDASLRKRPMRRVSHPLQQMGARFEWLGEEGRLPMRVHGGDLRPLAWTPEVPSAQVKSAILLAGLCANVEVRVVEALPTRDHTERMLLAAGALLEITGDTIVLHPTPVLEAQEIAVPGDPSSAAFFVALGAGAAAGALRAAGVLLNPRRTGFLRVLERMGARVEVDNERTSGGEPIGDLVIHASALQGTTIEPTEVPSLIDEIPILAALAALADGETRVSGAAELRVKESDRIATMVENLRACGVDAEEEPDGLLVRGPADVRDAAITTGGDHRIAMAFAVLGALTKRDLRVDDPHCVDVSFPSFWSDLARVSR